jgi:uncharacterized membrane protein
MTKKASNREHERGAIAPLMALLMVALFGFGAIAIDASLVQYRRRALQADVDAAALSAARAPASANSLATSSLASADSQIVPTTIQPGAYVDNPAIAATQRFTSGGTPYNAVQVTATRSVPLGIGRLFVPSGVATVSATAVAQSTPLASFSLGSGLVSVNNGIVNDVLGGLLGGNVSLSAVNYNGLAQTDLALFSYSDALATQLGVQAGTYQELLADQIGVGNALNVASTVLSSAGSSSAPAVSALAAAAGQTLTLGNLIDLQAHQDRTVGSFAADSSYLDLGANAFDLVTAAATLGGANHVVTLPAMLTLPGVANIAAQVLAIEPMQQSGGSVALGPVGATASTAQVRVLLNVSLLSTIDGGVVTLPVLLQVAPATATLTQISCQGNPATDTTLTVQANTGVASAQIGTVTNAHFANTAYSFGTLSPAPILSVSLNVLGATVGVKVLAQANAGPLASGSAALNFTQSDIANGTVLQVSSTSLGVGSLIGSLGSKVTLTTQIDTSLVPPLLLSAVNAALVPLVNTLLATVSTALSPVLTALDPEASQILAALGVQLGTASVRATGSLCGAATIVM